MSAETESQKILRLCPHFTIDEFKCHCCGACNMSEPLLTSLGNLRKTLNHPINVNSGYRCPTHNKLVGGVPTSMHLTGDAVDISTISMPPETHHYFMALATTYFTGIGIGKLFAHIDVRKNKAMWTYP